MSKQKKRKRARVQIAVDEQGKPVYKWANGYTKAELEASKTKIRIEYDMYPQYWTSGIGGIFMRYSYEYKKMTK